jgi:hypothetical protein
VKHWLRTTKDLCPSERRFLESIRELRFGYYECLRIVRGELVLDPWPKTIQVVKFSAENSATCGTLEGEFLLKRQISDFVEYVRGIEAGEIRRLEIRHGLPVTMELEPERGSRR